MQKLELQWREFNVDLEAVDVKLRAEQPSYKGNQAASCLELWFEELPSQEDQDAIIAWWEALTAESAEAQSYRSMTQIQAAIEAVKAGIPAKTWNTLVMVERKMVLGQLPTKAELIAASLL